MKLFCVLACTLAAVVVQGETPPESYAVEHNDYYTIEEVRQLARDLEDSVDYMNQLLSDSSTLSAVAAEKTIHLTDFIVPKIIELNADQEERITAYDAEIKDLEHKTDDLKVATVMATTQAEGNEEKVDKLNAEFYALPVLTDAIAAIEYDAASEKDRFLQELESRMAALNTANGAVYADLEQKKQFLKGRTCQYGTDSFSPAYAANVTFKTPFRTVPSVSLSITGFQSHLDQSSYENYNGLSMMKTITPGSITPYGFEVDVVDNSVGMVQVKKVYCSYMACEDEVLVGYVAGN